MIGPATAEARLKQAPWLQTPALRKLFDLLDAKDHRTRAVGGIVRDTILDMPRLRTDIDLATEFEPEEVIRRSRTAGFDVIPTGIAHGTVTVRAEDASFEVTTLRKDVETDGRHAVVRFGTNWAEDASRRDFTLNALYADGDGELFDPLNGLPDCLNARVRFIGDPDRRIAEDGLRVYRFFRFTMSHGKEVFDPEGLDACARAISGLDHISAERIGAEMRRVLGLPRVVGGLRRMQQIGLLDLSEAVLERLARYERQIAAPNPAARMALLIDGISGAELGRLWRLSNAEVVQVEHLHRASGLIADMRLYEAVYRHHDYVMAALDIAAVREGWGEAGKAAVREQIESIPVRSFPITGNDLLATGLTSGPELGRELERLERLWLDSAFALDREQLLAAVGRGRT